MNALDPAQTIPAKEAMPVQPAKHEPLLEMWQQYVDAESRANERGITDDERDRRCDHADAIGAPIASTPARTMAGLVAKLRFIEELLDPTDGAAYRAIVSAIADAERLAGGAS